MNDILKSYQEFLQNTWPLQKAAARGLGLRRRHNNVTLDVWFPVQCLKNDEEIFAVLAFVTQSAKPAEVVSLDIAQMTTALEILTHIAKANRLTPSSQLALAILQAAHRNYEKSKHSYAQSDVLVFVSQDLQQPVLSAEEAYFKLHLLSHRLVQPQTINVNGIFGQLQNIAWTNQGPILPHDVTQQRLESLMSDNVFQVTHVDKFPYMLDYVVPSGVRIADAARVRLGAHLAEGTTVMPAGYVNFNAGTLGPSMIEGRVSAGVAVGSGTDVGGGASIMGTLSGGGKEVVSLGQNCLLGANAGVGISLGNGCTIAAGVYVTASAKVSLYNAQNEPIDIGGQCVSDGENIVKARELSGKDFLLFLIDSTTGKLVCKPNQKQISLNATLHKN